MNRVVGFPEKSCPVALETTTSPAAFAAASTCPAKTSCVPIAICLSRPLRYAYLRYFTASVDKSLSCRPAGRARWSARRLLPSIARASAADSSRKRYTPHEVGAPRVAGPSGRTQPFGRIERREICFCIWPPSPEDPKQQENLSSPAATHLFQHQSHRLGA
jgi:hypothetical protein